MSKVCSSKAAVEKKNANQKAVLCECFVGFISAEINLTLYKILQRDIQGDSGGRVTTVGGDTMRQCAKYLFMNMCLII